MLQWITRMRIDGFRCMVCVNRLERVLEKHGAERVHVDPVRHFGTVTFTGEKADAETYIEAIEDLGYEVSLLTIVPIENE